MSESQSRYGILEELNNRKINQKEKLSNIERETDQKVYDWGKRVEEAKKEISDKEGSYVREHKDSIRELEVNLKLLTQDFERKEKHLESVKTEAESNYEQIFQTWKAEKERLLKLSEDGLDRYQATQKLKVDEKKEIITEIESGINNLKEVSKESKQE